MKTKSTILALIGLIAFASSAFAQSLTVNGKVVEANGEPVIGAAVMQRDNNSNGVITDIDGAFTIVVPAGSSLVFSSLGFADVTLKATSWMEVMLQADSNFLEEVVIVGYGVQKKSNLTGSISSVDAKDIGGRTITNVSQALQGKTAGVNLVATSAQPGAVPTVRVRGIASNGTSDPLYVVDGLITTDISGIDPNTIKSMEVLKDAASAAIYGAQAGNGVILINTKRGDKGSSSLTYDFQYTLNSLARKPALLSAKEYLEQQIAYSPSFTEDDMLKLIERGVWDGVSSTNWYDAVFTTSPTQRHSITAQGANDKGSFFLSLSSLDEDGIIKMKRDYYKRVSATVNADYAVKPWMKVGITADFANFSCGPVTDALSTHGNGFYLNTFGATISLPAYLPDTYEPGSLPDAMQVALDQGLRIYQDEKGNYYNAVTSHPLAMILAREMKNYGNILSGTAYANFTPIKGLTFTSRLGYKISDTHKYVYAHKVYLASSVQIKDNSASRTNNSNTYYQLENFVNWNKSFGKHNIGAMAGMSFSENTLTYMYGNVTNTIEDKDTFADLSYASSVAGKTIAGYSMPSRKLSYFGRISYDYDGKYLAEVIGRADAADASVLPKENRWGFFPSVSAGWVVSKEDFFKDLSFPVSFLKLRGSWGVNGSTSNLGNYSYSNSLYLESAGYSYTNTGNIYQTVAYPTQIYNPGLKWETSRQLDLGIDIRAFGDKLSVSADYFDKQTHDLIISGIKVSYEAGNATAPMNAGNIANRGFELDLGWKDTIGDFFYSVSGNIATLDNRVTYLDPNVADGRIPGVDLGGNYVTFFEEGMPVWYFRGYQVEGLDENGAPIFKNLDDDPAINDNDKAFIGKPLPDFTYGFTLSLGYKGIDFTLFGNGAAGNQVMNAYSVKSIKYTLKEMYDKSWPNGPFAAPSENNADKYVCSDAMIFDGSYFRIKQIQLGYTLPSNLSRKFFVEKLRLYTSVDNAFLFTKYPGLDPEVASNTVSGIGIDFGCYPTTRKIVFGANITF